MIIASSSQSESENEQKKNNSNFLTECEKAFGLTDFYSILSLNKEKSSLIDIKKSYYKLSLKYHPDKVTDVNLKEESQIKFQCLGKIYSILNDTEKKKLYDETGLIDGEEEEEEDIFKGDQKDWDDYFRTMFKKVSEKDINQFFETYIGSKEEREDLIRIYEKCDGDMAMIMEEMISNDCNGNEPRFKEIILDAIEKKETKKLDLFVKESKKKAAKRKAHYAKEAEEAEEAKKELGIDQNINGEDSLRNMILARRKDQSTHFLDNLAAKYGAAEKDGKTKVFKGKGGKKKAVETESESSDDASKDSEGEEENSPPPVKKRASKVTQRKKKEFGY